MAQQINLKLSEAFASSIKGELARAGLTVRDFFAPVLAGFVAWYEGGGEEVSSWFPRSAPSEGQGFSLKVEPETKAGFDRLAERYGVSVRSIYYSALLHWARERGIELATPYDSTHTGSVMLGEAHAKKLKILVVLGTFETHREFWEEAVRWWVDARRGHGEASPFAYRSRLHGAPGAQKVWVVLARPLYAELQRWAALDSQHIQAVYYNVGASYLDHIKIDLSGLE